MQIYIAKVAKILTCIILAAFVPHVENMFEIDRVGKILAKSSMKYDGYTCILQLTFAFKIYAEILEQTPFQVHYKPGHRFKKISLSTI